MTTKLYESEQLEITAFHGGIERGPCLQFDADGWTRENGSDGCAQLTFPEVEAVTRILQSWLAVHRDTHDMTKPRNPGEHALQPVDGMEGISQCVVCGGAEGTLPTECPGVKMTAWQEDAIMHCLLDFKGGKWLDATSEGFAKKGATK